MAFASGQAIAYTIVAVDKATRNLAKTSKEVAKLNRNFIKSALSAKKLKGALHEMTRMTGLKGLIAGFVSFQGMKGIVEKGMEFQDAVQGIAVITGAAGEELKLYSDESRRLSERWGVSAAEIATSIKDVASGKSELLDFPDKLIAITDQAIALSVAAGITVPEGVKAMVGSLNQFGKGQEHAARFAGILATSAKVGAAEIPDMVESLKIAGTVAAGNNMTFAETNTLLQLMAKSGLKGSMSGTGLAGVIKGLKEKLKWDPKEMGFADAMMKIKKQVEAGKIDTLELFGAEHEKSALAILGNIHLYKSFHSQIAKADDLQRQVAAREETFSKKLAKIREKINNKVIELFFRLEPKLTEIANTLADKIGNIDTSDIEKVGQIMSTMLSVASAIFSLMQGFKDLADWLGESTAQFIHSLPNWMKPKDAPSSSTYFDVNPEEKAKMDWFSAGPIFGSDSETAAENAASVTSAADDYRNSTLNLNSRLDIEMNDPSGAVKKVTQSQLDGIKKKVNMAKSKNHNGNYSL